MQRPSSPNLVQQHPLYEPFNQTRTLFNALFLRASFSVFRDYRFMPVKKDPFHVLLQECWIKFYVDWYNVITVIVLPVLFVCIKS